MVEDLLTKTINMTLPINYTPWHRFADWSDRGVYLPQEVLEKVNEEIFKKLLRPHQSPLRSLLLRAKEDLNYDIRGQYIRGFNAKIDEALEQKTSLELLEMGLVDDRGRKCECHPGRFSLNPDAGTRAVGGNPGLLCEALPWGVRMTAREWGRKHRKLSSSAEIWDSTFVVTGCQDVYFLGGLPLQYWSFGDRMGLKLPDKEMSEKTEWLSGNWMWRDKGDVALYQLTDGLLAFGEYGGAHSKDIDIWTYTKYLNRQEQAMIDGKCRFT